MCLNIERCHLISLKMNDILNIVDIINNKLYTTYIHNSAYLVSDNIFLDPEKIYIFYFCLCFTPKHFILVYSPVFVFLVFFPSKALSHLSDFLHCLLQYGKVVFLTLMLDSIFKPFSFSRALHY